MQLKIVFSAIGIASLVSMPAFAAMGHAVAPSASMRAAPITHSTGPSSPQGPTRTGQPNQTCGSATAPNTPGNAATAPGSAFNPGGTAGGVYAGQQPQNSRNTASVSQYDVACAHQSR